MKRCNSRGIKKWIKIFGVIGKFVKLTRRRVAFWDASLWNHDPWARLLNYMPRIIFAIISGNMDKITLMKVKDSRACMLKGLSYPNHKWN